jgi:hypothetical protein
LNSPHICNKELHFYLSRKGDFICYFTDQFFVKQEVNTKKILIQHELPEEILPNQLSSVTFNFDESQMLILPNAPYSNCLNLMLFDIKSGKVNRLLIEEASGQSLSLSKHQGFRDGFLYQSKLQG